MLTYLPYVYWLNFSTAYTAASISFSICAYLVSVSVRARLAKAIGSPFLQQGCSNPLFTCVTLYCQLFLWVVEFQYGSFHNQRLGLSKCFIVNASPLPFFIFMCQFPEWLHDFWWQSWQKLGKVQVYVINPQKRHTAFTLSGFGISRPPLCQGRASILHWLPGD